MDHGEIGLSCHLANTISKATDSLPAKVGALRGTYQGRGVVSLLREALVIECRRRCLPFFQGARLDECADLPAARISSTQ